MDPKCMGKAIPMRDTVCLEVTSLAQIPINLSLIPPARFYIRAGVERSRCLHYGRKCKLKHLSVTSSPLLTKETCISHSFTWSLSQEHNHPSPRRQKNRRDPAVCDIKQKRLEILSRAGSVHGERKTKLPFTFSHLSACCLFPACNKT